MTLQLAATVFAVLAASAAAFQVALMLGAPWGHLTWGGQFAGTLPVAMRGVAFLSCLLLMALAFVVGARAGQFGARAQQGARLATWGVVVYSALGVLANAATPSAPERALWLPVALLMLVTSGWVAWKTR